MSIRLGLDRILPLLHALGNPHEQIQHLFHIAGTNGKGSVASFIETALIDNLSSQYCIGSFKSPHLIHPRDSISINGHALSKNLYDQFNDEIIQLSSNNNLKISEFERLWAIACLAFSRHSKISIAIVEVGMGGKLDATNVFSSKLQSHICAFTSVSLDHEQYLGNTIQKIALEKSGILKSGSTCIIGNQKEVNQIIMDKISNLQNVKFVKSPMVYWTSKEKSHIWIDFNDTDNKLLKSSIERIKSPPLDSNSNSKIIQIKMPLLGDFQLDNISIAIAALYSFFEINQGNLKLKYSKIDWTSLEKTKWPGRLEWIDVQKLNLPSEKKVLIDGAHNIGAIKELREYLNQISPTPLKISWIFSFTSGKPISEMLNILLNSSSKNDIIITEFSTPQDMPWIKSTCANEFKRAIPKSSNVNSITIATNIKNAIDIVKNNFSSSDLIVVCGSLYLLSNLYREFSI